MSEAIVLSLNGLYHVPTNKLDKDKRKKKFRIWCIEQSRFMEETILNWKQWVSKFMKFYMMVKILSVKEYGQ